MPVSEINRQSVAAAKWTTLGTIMKFGLQLFAQIVLARLIGPEGFGLFAMGLVVLTLSNFVANFGFAWSLIQCQDLSDEDIRFTFTWQLIFGTLMASGLYFLAPAVAGYFNEPKVEPVVRWLSLACVINAIAAPATNLLRRALDFRAVHLIYVASYLIGYLAVGIPLAYTGWGVWALVAAWTAQALSALLLSFIRHPHPIKPLLWHAGAGKLSQVGLTVFVTNISNWLLNNLDRIFLGRFGDAQAVGVYVTGYMLATTPNLMLAQAQPVFLAAGAKIQSEPERLRRAYLSILATLWVTIAPMFVVVAIVAQDLVDVLYGVEWSLAGVVLSILALAMPAYMTYGMSTPILWNTGRKHYECLLQLPVLALAAVGFYAVAREGVVMVAAVGAGIFLARAIVITAAACRQLDIRCRDLLPFAARGGAMLILAAAGAFAGMNLGGVSGMQAGAVLGGLLFGCGFPVLAALVVPGLLGETVVEMLGRFSPALCASLRLRVIRQNATR
jgi:PST family polysaccharide transporter